MVAPIDAHQKPVSKIFYRDYVFSIPNYQRPYAWTIEQARELYEDLLTAMKGSKKMEELSPYFLGSIVLIKKEELPEADVVDGQQRLTTLTLLLSAVRALVDAKNATTITNMLYQRGEEIMGTKDQFRLSLRDRDAEFFRKYVQKEDGFEALLKLDLIGSDSQRNIIKNAQWFYKELVAMDEPERVRLATFIATRCFLVVVSTPDLDSAYRIFSVLNSRGLDLSATDILKAEIIGAIPNDQRDTYTEKWETVEEDLGREPFGDLFSQIRMVYRKAKPQGTLLKEFKEHVAGIMSATSFIDDVLVPMADVHEFLTDANYRSSIAAEKVNEPLKWLNRLEFVDWIPPALAFAVRHKNEPENMRAFVVDLERLAYGMLLSKFGINERIERFSSLTAAIERNDDLFAEKSPLQLSKTEQFTIYEALSGPFYASFAARARTTVLLRLDSLVSGGGATYDYPIITVEHVLPQKPKTNSRWIDWVSDPLERQSLVHQLGNLALLTRKKNSSASNYELDKKQASYFTVGGISPFVLTTQVLGKTSWTSQAIIGRQKELLEKLEAHWRLENRESPADAILKELVS